MTKMMGRLGWRGQCACCNGPRGHDQIRAEEKCGWIAEALEDARDRFEALPPDIREAALRSGTRATMGE